MSDAPLRPDDAPPSLYGADGKPQFFADPAMDRFVAVLLNLTSELWIQNEAIVNLSALIAEKGLASGEDIDAMARTASADPERDTALREFIDRVLTPLREDQKR